MTTDTRADIETPAERNTRIVTSNRYRLHLALWGLTLNRSRCRVQGAPEYGGYRITNRKGEIVYGGETDTHPTGYSATLDDIGEYLDHLKGKA